VSVSNKIDCSLLSECSVCDGKWLTYSAGSSWFDLDNSKVLIEPGSSYLGLPNVFWHSNHKHQQVSQFVLLLVSTGTKFWICKVSQSDGDPFQAVALNCSGANSLLSVLEFGSLHDCSLENIPAHHMLQQGNPGWHGYTSGLCKEYITDLKNLMSLSVWVLPTGGNTLTIVTDVDYIFQLSFVAEIECLN
jgi:hypothetical protein